MPCKYHFIFKKKGKYENHLVFKNALASFKIYIYYISYWKQGLSVNTLTNKNVTVKRFADTVPLVSAKTLADLPQFT